jgi:uncharacterized protein YlzI (FlbEa/FlbD family)
MEKVYFSLETGDDNRLTKTFRVILGLLCVAIALYWTIFNFKSGRPFGTQWITVAFLIAFGAFQIYAGFGLAIKFIEIFSDNIRIKKNSVLPAINISSDQIEKTELFPLKVIFFLRSGKKVLLRFGISDPDKVEEIKSKIVEFADSNGLTLEIMSEVL